MAELGNIVQLVRHQAALEAVGGQQLMQRPLLGDAPVLQDDDVVGAQDGGELVADPPRR